MEEGFYYIGVISKKEKITALPMNTKDADSGTANNEVFSNFSYTQVATRFAVRLRYLLVSADCITLSNQAGLKQNRSNY